MLNEGFRTFFFSRLADQNFTFNLDCFFVSFFTWFNMAPLATTMVQNIELLTIDHIKVLAIINVALTIPARIIIGMMLDKYGPRLVFSGLLIAMAIPAFAFAFGNTWTQLLFSRLILSTIGASFVVGIRMVAEWFLPKSVGFAEGFYAGWGNFGSAGRSNDATLAGLECLRGDAGWRYAVRRLRHKAILGQLYPCDQRTALIILCTINLLTKSLSPLEEALMMQGLVKEADFSLAEVGELWGYSKSWVSRRLKLLTGLDPQIKRELDADHLRPRVAQELARLPQGNDQTRVLALVKQY